MSSLPARIKKIQLKMKALECSQDFSQYKSIGIFPDAQGQLTLQSMVRSGLISNSSETLWLSSLPQGSYRNMKTKFQDFSRIITGLLSVFKDSISLTFRQFLIVFAGNGDSEIGRISFLSPEYFHIVLINTGTTVKLNRSTVPPRSSTNPAIFTQFSFAHRINPKEWKRISVFYYFQGQFHIFKGNVTKFQDNSRTNGTILKFQEFSRTKVKFKDFSRSVRTLLK